MDAINIIENKDSTMRNNPITKKTSSYEPDTYMSQPKPGLHKEEHFEYYIEGNTCYVKKTIRTFYGDNDYQDSISTEVIGVMNNE